MKKLFWFLLVLLCTQQTFAQHVYQIRADSVRIYNVCDTAELIIENRTRGVSGFLYNKGNGRTEFRRIQLESVGNGQIAIIGQDTLDLSTLPGIGGIDTIYRSGNNIIYVKKGVQTTLNLPPPVSTWQDVMNNGNTSTLTPIVSPALGEGLKIQHDDGFISGYTSNGFIRNGFLRFSNSSVNLYTERNNAIYFGTNNLTRMTIAADGGVGINTFSPRGGGLDVNLRNSVFGEIPMSIGYSLNGYPGIGYNVLHGDADDSDKKYIKSDYANYIKFQSGGFSFLTAPAGTAGGTIPFSNRMVITESGKVGIGTTSPSANLDVNGTINSSSSVQASFFKASTPIYSTGGYHLLVHNLSTNTYERVSSIPSSMISGGVSTSSTWQDVMSNGRTSNITPFVYPASAEGLRIIKNGAFVSGYNDDATTRNGYVQFSGSGTNLYSEVNAPITFGTNGTARMTIAGGGNVGIGTNTPGEKLHVLGNILSDGGMIYGTKNNIIKDNGLYASSNINITSDSYPSIGFHKPGAWGSAIYAESDFGFKIKSYLGTEVPLWNGGNDGAGTGLDADLVDGYDVSQPYAGNTIPVRDGSGHLYANHFNTAAPLEDVGMPTKIFGSNDNYIRALNPASVRRFIGLPATGGSGDNLQTVTDAGSATTNSITAQAYNIQNGNTQLSKGNSDALKVSTPTGYVEYGSQNAGWAHFLTDRPAFYFDKDVHANGAFRRYNSTGYFDGFNMGLQSGDGNGIRFWDASPTYSITMASATSASGGRVLDLGANAYNMYFRMHGDNFGFVFVPGSGTPVAQIDNNGISNTGWFRSVGSTGWFNQTYGGGFYMTDNDWIRTFGNKNIYQNVGILRTDGELQVGSDGATLKVPNGGTPTIYGNMIYHAGNLPRPIYQKLIQLAAADGTSANNFEQGSTFSYASGSPFNGPLLSFGGLGGNYDCQINANYGSGGNDIAFRVRNGDIATWNSWKTFWHSGNVAFATKGNDIALKTESNGYLGIENWIRINDGTGFYTNSGKYFYNGGDGNSNTWALRGAGSQTTVLLELQTGEGIGRGGLFAASSGEVGIVNAGAVGWRLRTDVSGNAYVTGQVQATSFYQSSLRSLKKNITAYTASGLDVLTKAQVRTFQFKADKTGHTNIGFIADEVPDEMSIPGRTGVDQASTVALLVKSVQELNAQNQALKDEVKELKALVQELIKK